MNELDVMSLRRVTLNGGDAVDPNAMALFPGSDRLSPMMTSPLIGAASTGAEKIMAAQTSEQAIADGWRRFMQQTS
jgi:hypothetical protein